MTKPTIKELEKLQKQLDKKSTKDLDNVQQKRRDNKSAQQKALLEQKTADQARLALEMAELKLQAKQTQANKNAKDKAKKTADEQAATAALAVQQAAEAQTAYYLAQLKSHKSYLDALKIDNQINHGNPEYETPEFLNVKKEIKILEELQQKRKIKESAEQKALLEQKAAEQARLALEIAILKLKSKHTKGNLNAKDKAFQLADEQAVKAAKAVQQAEDAQTAYYLTQLKGQKSYLYLEALSETPQEEHELENTQEGEASTEDDIENGT